MKLFIRSLPVLLLVIALFSALFLIVHSASAKKKEGLFTSSSSDISATAGVRGGDVMGDAIKGASPTLSAVDRMEARKVSGATLDTFQKQGQVGKYAK